MDIPSNSSLEVLNGPRTYELIIIKFLSALKLFDKGRACAFRIRLHDRSVVTIETWIRGLFVTGPTANPDGTRQVILITSAIRWVSRDQHWPAPWFRIIYDTRTGTGHIRLLNPEEATCLALLT